MRNHRLPGARPAEIGHQLARQAEREVEAADPGPRPREQRSGTLQDVASVALFLASSGAAYVTGQTIIVNGGYGGARLGS